MKTYDIIVKEKPKWYQARWKLSNLLVFIARKIYPENPEVMAFVIKQMTDMAIYGGSITHFDYKDFANKSLEPTSKTARE